MKEISEGDLYKNIYDVDPTDIFHFILRVKDYYRISDKPAVLDIGAGTGRFLTLFDELKWMVTGTEPYPEYYKYLKERFKNHPRISITEEAFQAIHYQEYFDMILSINGPFSYLLTAEDREIAIKRSYTALKKNGILLIDTSNFSWILKNYRPPVNQSIDMDGRIVERSVVHEFDFHHNIMTHIDTFKIDRGRKIKSVHKFYMIGYQEIEYLLKKNHFKNITSYNGYRALEPGPIDNKRMIIVAQKS